MTWSRLLLWGCAPALVLSAVIGAAVQSSRAQEPWEFFRRGHSERPWYGAYRDPFPSYNRSYAPTDGQQLDPNDPRSWMEQRRDSSRYSRRSQNYCVRACDGYYFPLAASVREGDAAELCQSLCPAAATEVYRGGGGEDAMAEAVSRKGKRYSALPNAYAYRTALNSQCTCRAADKKPLTVMNDPTLRSGDLVATANGLQVFTGSAKLPHQERDFADHKKGANGKSRHAIERSRSRGRERVPNPGDAFAREVR